MPRRMSGIRPTGNTGRTLVVLGSLIVSTPHALASLEVVPPVPAAGAARERADGLSPDVFAAIARLNDDAFSEREQADRALSRMAQVDPEAHGLSGETGLDAIEQHLIEHADSLGPEGRRRLSRFAISLYRALPMAGMGMGPEGLDDGSVRIAVIVPGFDIARVLRHNDIVLSMGGVPLAGDRHMRAEILSYRPGDPVEVTYLRNGELRTGTVTLGSFEDLANPRSVQSTLARDAWRARFERRSRAAAEGDAAPSERLSDGLDAAAWLEAEAVAPNSPREAAFGRFADPRFAGANASAPTGLVDAYQRRSARPVDPPLPRDWRRPDVRAVADREASERRENDGEFAQALRAQLAQLAVMRETLTATLDIVLGQLAVPDLPEDQRDTLDERADAIRDQIGAVEAQADRLRAQLDE